MEAIVKYRVFASCCLLVAALSALGRWQLLSVRSQAEAAPKPDSKTEAQTFRYAEPPKLPSPDFLRFTAVPMKSTGGIDLADNGAVLAVFPEQNLVSRTYQYFSPEGKTQQLLPSADTERYALSQQGRLLKFQVNASGFRGTRRGGFRMPLELLFTSNLSVFDSPRRFLENGSSIGFRSGESKENSLLILKEGGATQTIFKSKEFFTVAEVDDNEQIWVWEAIVKGRDRELLLHRLKGAQRGLATLPKIDGTPKLVTTTKQASVVTYRTRGNDPRHRAFRQTSNGWKEILAPKGFHSALVQRVTNDGLMFGVLESDGTHMVPVVWKDGTAYDLRRHPLWPLGGYESYIEIANRRGDLIVTSLGPGGPADLTTLLLRRSTSVRSASK